MMGPSDLRIRHGVMMVKFRGDWIALDPNGPVRANYVFVSHAHSDHVPPSLGASKLIASRETAELLKAKGLKFDSFVEEMEGIELVDTGHILGSRALLVEGRVLYTGDIAGRPRAFLGRAKPRSCETLIIESTYGKRGYAFPPVAETVKEGMEAITREFEKGRGIALMGYSLGKAQLLTYLFQSWRPLIVHRSIMKFNKIYGRLGVELPEPDRIIGSVDELPKNGPFLLIAPNNPLVGRALRKRGVRTIPFTGWALFGSGLPLSDHADFRELVRFVRRARPERVYTVFGFYREFARELREEGFDARPISSLHTYITDFFE